MNNLKVKQHQPWLTHDGVELPVATLKIVSRSWDASTWEAYLNWFESGRRESLIHPQIYGRICSGLTEGVLGLLGQSGSRGGQALCERVLKTLPKAHAKVLRLAFLEGRTEAEIAFALNRSRGRVHQIKNRAIQRLKLDRNGDPLCTRRFMKGEISGPLEASPWLFSFGKPLKEHRNYRPGNHRLEFARIRQTSVRKALTELSDMEQRIIYLRHWCELPLAKVGQLLATGVNVVDQIEAASISKVKRRALELESLKTQKKFVTKRRRIQ